MSCEPLCSWRHARSCLRTVDVQVADGRSKPTLARARNGRNHLDVMDVLLGAQLCAGMRMVRLLSRIEHRPGAGRMGALRRNRRDGPGRGITSPWRCAKPTVTTTEGVEGFFRMTKYI